MYFASGWPKRYHHSHDDGPLLALQHNPTRSHFVVLSPNCLSLWSGGQDTVLLASASLPASLWSKYGHNRSVEWSADSSLIAVLLQSGHICMYNVALGEHGVRLHADSSLMSIGCAANLELRALLRTPHGGADCMARGGGENEGTLFVVTKQEHLLNITWSGQLISDVPLSAIPFIDDCSLSSATQPLPSSPFATPTKQHSSSSSSSSTPAPAPSPSPSLVSSHYTRSSYTNLFAAASTPPPSTPTSASTSTPSSTMPSTPSQATPSSSRTPAEPHQPAVRHIVYSAAMSVLGIVFMSGRAALVSTEKQQDDGKQLMRGHWLPFIERGQLMEAVTLRFNSCNRFAAVAYQSGEVRLFDISSPRYPLFLRTLAPTDFEGCKRDFGPASALAWTPDGRALAVGWISGGFALWSSYGSRLCISPASESALCGKGVASLSWGREGYRLLLTAPPPDTGDEKAFLEPEAVTGDHHHAASPVSFEQINFVKAAHFVELQTGEEERLVMWGEAELLLYCPNELNETMKWQRIQVPQTYLTDNWPIVHVAVSPESGDVAIAGRRGVAIYSASVHRWRLFGDRSEEQELECLGMTWYRSLLVLAVKRHPHGVYEILFYPRRYLSARALVHRVKVSPRRVPHLLAVRNDSLIVLTRDGFIQCYHLMIEDAETIKPSLSATPTQTIAMPGLTSMALPSSLTLIPPPPYTQAEAGSNTEPLWALVNCSGTLLLTNLAFGIQIEIGQQIEAYWWVTSRHLLPHMGDMIWTLGPNGLQYSFPYSEEGVMPIIRPWLPHNASGPLSPRKKSVKATKEYRHVTFVGWEDGVYPIAVSSHTMLVTALSPQSGSSFLKPLPSFNFETKNQPFLHSVVAYLLQSDNCSLYQVDATDDEDHPLDAPKEIALSDDDSDSDGDSDDEKENDEEEGEIEDDASNVADERHSNGNGHANGDTGKDKAAKENGSGVTKTKPQTGRMRRRGTADRMEHAKKYYALYTLSRPYDHLPHYRHSLELLLHQALQEEEEVVKAASKRRGSKSRLKGGTTLTKVVDFLRGLDAFAEVVVGCARKIDPASWDLLFAYVGSPDQFFNECLERGALHMAGGLLPVVRYMGGMTAAAMAALGLLEATLESCDMHLLRHVVRFLNMLVSCNEEEEAESKSYSNGENGNASHVRENSTLPGKEEKMAMDLLLARYARKLLMKYRIHDIHYLSKVVLNKKIADVLRRGVKRTFSSDAASPTATTAAATTATLAASSDDSPTISSSTPPQPQEPSSTTATTPQLPSTPTASRSLFSFLSFASPAPPPPETPDTDAPVAVPPIDTPPAEPTEQATEDGDGDSDDAGAVAAESESKKRAEPLRNIINSNDFGSALFGLHLQFGVPFPQRYSPSPYFTLLSSLHAGLGEGGIAMEPVRDRELIEVQAAYQNAVEDALVHQVQDLQTLLADLEEAGVIEWAVVVATALLDLRAVTRLLREYHELCPAFHAMFASLSCKGYSEFLKCVDAEHEPACSSLPSASSLVFSPPPPAAASSPP